MNACSVGMHICVKLFEGDVQQATRIRAAFADQSFYALIAWFSC
jgi:hypothetical protein